MSRRQQGGGGGSSSTGGGSVNTVSGDGVTTNSTGGTDPIISVTPGTGTGSVQEATATAIGTTLDATLGNGILKLAGAVLTAAALLNADVSASAAIDGTKISPNFGNQAVVTTGTLGAGATTVTSLSVGSLSGVVKASTGTITAATLVNADVDAAAAIVASKLNLTTIAQNIANTGTFGNTGDVTITGSVAASAVVQAGAASKFRFGASGATQTSGTGAPSAGEVDGSIYQRTDGAAATTVYVRAAGAWSALGGGGSFTAATDLAGDNTAQTVIGITGASNKTIIRDTSRSLEWASTTTTPGITMATHATTPQAMTIAAGAVTTGTGSALALAGGAGTTAGGAVTITGGAATTTGGAVTISGGTGSTPAGVTLGVGGTVVYTVTTGTSSVAATLVNSGTANSLAAEFQTSATLRFQIGNDATSAFIRNASSSVATIGLLRFTAGQQIMAYRKADNGSDYSLIQINSDNLFIGGKSDNTLQPAFTVIGSGSQVQLRVGSANILQAGGAGINLNAAVTVASPTLTFDTAQATPSLSQVIAVSGATAQAMTIAAQAPNSGSSGAFRIPGDLILKTAAATNSGTTHAFVRLQAKATDVLIAGHDNTNPTLRLYVATQTTVGAAGGGAAVPLTTTGFWIVNLGGTEYAVPYFAKA